MGNQFVISTGTAAPVVARVFAITGEVWRKSAAEGGTDPASFVAFTGAEAAGGQYDLPTAEIVGAGGEFVFTMPMAVPAGSHSFRAYSAGALVRIVPAGDVGYWDGVDFSIGFTQADRVKIDAIYSGAVAASTPAESGAMFDPVAADTAVYWSYLFTRSIVITGWQAVAFTLKTDPTIDSDLDALLAVRLTYPAAGTDGILVHNRRLVSVADPLRTKGLVAVEGTDPNALVRVTLLPEALQLPPSPDALPYWFELDYWLGDGIKRQMGRGEFRLARSVRRNVVVP